MHTCPPPFDALDDWLEANGTIEGRYGHLLLEQIKPVDQVLIDAMRPYFESAHLDAREHFHHQIAIDLHPARRALARMLVIRTACRRRPSAGSSAR